MERHSNSPQILRGRIKDRTISCSVDLSGTTDPFGSSGDCTVEPRRPLRGSRPEGGGPPRRTRSGSRIQSDPEEKTRKRPTSAVSFGPLDLFDYTWVVGPPLTVVRPHRGGGEEGTVFSPLRARTRLTEPGKINLSVGSQGTRYDWTSPHGPEKVQSRRHTGRRHFTGATPPPSRPAEATPAQEDTGKGVDILLPSTSSVPQPSTTGRVPPKVLPQEVGVNENPGTSEGSPGVLRDSDVRPTRGPE